MSIWLKDVSQKADTNASLIQSSYHLRRVFEVLIEEEAVPEEMDLEKILIKPSYVIVLAIHKLWFYWLIF